MRLTEHQIESIKEAFAAYFLEDDHIWLFGSRVDLTQKGGDIDLYIETAHESSVIVEKKINFLVDLKHRIGDQKIDLIVNVLSEKRHLSIYEEARTTGVKIT